MNRNAPRPPLGNRNENGPGPIQQGGYPHPSIPPQARSGPQRQYSRPTMRDPQPALQRQPSRPDQQYSDQPALQRQRSRPDQQQYQDQQPVLQRQPSRPDQQYQDQPPQRSLQRQPSRPDQYYPDQQPRQGEPMDPYAYAGLPTQPAASVAPVLMRAPSAPSASLPHSDSQATLFSPPSRPYAQPVMRGNSDDELDKSDIFWRRFNASAHQQQQPDAEKSSWLEKTTGKSSRHNRRLWIVGLVLVLLAAGGIGLGVFLSFRSTSNTTRPDTIGGAADITSAGSGPTTAARGTVGVGAAATTSSLHVSPTNTVP